MFTLVTGDLGIVGRWRAVCVTALQRPNSDAAAIRIVVGIAAASLSVTVPLQLCVSRLNLFQVNPSDGEISVVNGDLLDRERIAFYYATLKAQDGMNATGTTLLEIELLDINDCIPTAIGVYNIFVNENTENVSIQLEATDNDEPGNNNSVIEYEILPSEFSGNFSINVTTGLITSISPLDREAINISQKGRIILTVKLYDLGIPSLSSNVSVTINVETDRFFRPRMRGLNSAPTSLHLTMGQRMRRRMHPLHPLCGANNASVGISARRNATGRIPTLV
ncbi:unnamed protein product [Ranitomeya imitator]|uniref:Cadherin domain-containing protein n=1 Tax=Ranitomeya imitator TaxID=111125 RepID=A0ABN9L557_9NEOB|nr:unnamed protein product [Ranitomeya imitator]